MENEAVKILVVDDEANIRRAVQITLQNEGYHVHVCDGPIAAFQQLATQDYDLAIVDIRMGSVSGIDLYRKMAENGITLPVIFVSGNASLSEAAEAVKLGAYDFVEKPFNNERLTTSIRKCLEHESLKRQLKDLSQQLPKNEFVGPSQASQRILEQIAKVAKSQATVLIQGESGTGKELIAKQIHEQSERKNRPFVKVNCSAIPETLIESELFGFEKGAFTGAAYAKRGFFEQAHHGTLFLDEIGDMSLSAQAKILRAIQNSEIQRLGSERVTPVNARIVAATNKDLRKEVDQGRFREDLYYRISVVPIHSVPLRERPEDIPALVTWFLKRFCSSNGIREKTIDLAAMDELRRYPWPGNVRELQNLVERLVIMGGQQIGIKDLPEQIMRSRAAPPSEAPSGPMPWKTFREHTERCFLISVLKSVDGNISRAAEVLEIERTYLHKKIAQYSIEKREYF